MHGVREELPQRRFMTTSGLSGYLLRPYITFQEDTMDFEQTLHDCGDSLEKFCALAESLAEEIDRAYADENEERCATLHYRFSRLCTRAQESLSPADFHRFRLKVDSLQKGNRPPVV